MTIELQVGNAKLPEREVLNDLEVEKTIADERRTKPRLSKYVRRHHPIEKIIQDKYTRPMTRRRSASGTCLVSKLEPKIMKEELENEVWITAMNEEIDQIEKNKTWSLVP